MQDSMRPEDSDGVGGRVAPSASRPTRRDYHGSRMASAPPSVPRDPTGPDYDASRMVPRATFGRSDGRASGGRVTKITPRRLRGAKQLGWIASARRPPAAVR